MIHRDFCFVYGTRDSLRERGGGEDNFRTQQKYPSIANPIKSMLQGLHAATGPLVQPLTNSVFGQVDGLTYAKLTVAAQGFISGATLTLLQRAWTT